MMNILYIGSDEHLAKKMKQIKGAGEVTMTSFSAFRSGSAGNDAGLVVVSDREVHHLELERLKNDSRPDVSFVYLLSSRANMTVLSNVSLLCSRLGIQVVAPKRTVEQICGDLSAMFFEPYKNERRAKVITFLGTHRQIGLTGNVLSFADDLSSRVQEEVCVLQMNAFNPGIEYIKDYEGHYLDDLYTRIQETKVLTSLELRQNMHKHRHFYYLAGNSDLTKRYRYHSESIHYLIQLAKEQFGVILIDAGADPDNNMCIQSLLHADMKIVMATQQPKSVFLWNRFLEDILKFLHIGEDEFLLVINKYSAVTGYEAGEIQTQMRVPLLGTFPDLGVSALDCELDRRLFTAIADKRDKAAYMKELRRMTDLVMRHFQLTPKPVEESKKKAWGGMFG